MMRQGLFCSTSQAICTPKVFSSQRHALKWRNEEVSSMNEFRLRKAHWEGEGNACCCLNIPKQFWQRMEIDKESYLKVTYRQDEQKLIVEKLVDGGHVDNT